MSRQRKRVIKGITVDPDMPHMEKPQTYFDNITDVEIVPQEAFGLLPFTRASKRLGGGVLLDVAGTPQPDFPEYDATIVNTLARLGFDIMALTAYDNPVFLATSPDSSIYFYNTVSANGTITHNLLFPEWMIGTGGTIIIPPVGTAATPTTPPIPRPYQFPPNGDPPSGTVIIDPPYSGGQSGTPTGTGSTRPVVGTPGHNTTTNTGYDVLTYCFGLRPTLYTKSGNWVQEYKHSIRNAIDNAIRSVVGDKYHSPRQLIGIKFVAGGYIVTQTDFSLNIKFKTDGNPQGESPPPGSGVGSGVGGGGSGSIALPPVKDGNIFLPVVVADNVGYSNCPPDFVNVELNPFKFYFGEFAFPVTASVTGDIWAGLQEFAIGGDPPLSSNIRANDVNVTLAAAVIPVFKLFLSCFQIRLYPDMNFEFHNFPAYGNIAHVADTNPLWDYSGPNFHNDHGNPPPSFSYSTYDRLETGSNFPADDIPNSLKFEFDYRWQTGTSGNPFIQTVNIIGQVVGTIDLTLNSQPDTDSSYKHASCSVPININSTPSTGVAIIFSNAYGDSQDSLQFDNLVGVWKYPDNS